MADDGGPLTARAANRGLRTGGPQSPRISPDSTVAVGAVGAATGTGGDAVRVTARGGSVHGGDRHGGHRRVPIRVSRRSSAVESYVENNSLFSEVFSPIRAR